jgi:signal transduction histidine kinase
MKPVGVQTVAAALSAVGWLQPGVGLQDRAPRLLLHVVVIAGVPLLAGLCLLSVWHTHVALTSKATALEESRSRLITAADRERSQIERDLQAGPQRHISVAVRKADAAQHLLTAQPGQVSRALGELTAILQGASAELRELAHGIFPPQLAETGLQEALQAAATRAALPTAVHASGVGHYRPDIETSVYFVCMEALQNAVKHAGPQATITIRLKDRDGLSFDVRDTGNGCTPATIHAGGGFTKMSDRVGAISGAVAVHAAPGKGVHLHGHIPRSALAGSGGGSSYAPSAATRAFAALWRLASSVWGRPRQEQTAPQQLTAGVKSLAAIVASSGALTLAAYAPTGNRWLLALGAASAIICALLAGALHLARLNRVAGAIAICAAVFWVYSPAITTLVPAALPFSSLLVVMPVVLAAPQLPRRRFQILVAATVVAAFAVALAGRLLPGTGLNRIPGTILDLALITLVVFGTAVTSFLAWQAHVSLMAKAEALQHSRARLVAAADRERRRIERNLHDGAQQRLVAAALQSRVAQRLLTTHQDKVEAVLSGLAEDLRQASTELRDLALGIYPVQLAEHGLEVALRAAATRSPSPVTVQAGELGRYRPDIEVNVYFCCLEALQNATKHAGGGAQVFVSLRDRNGLSFEVRDTGVGCQPDVIHRGRGFSNMRDRLNTVGGILSVDAVPGQGVCVQGHIANCRRASVDDRSGR